MRGWLVAAGLAAALCTSAVQADETNGRNLTVEDIYGPKALQLDRPPAAKWLASGDAYTLLVDAAGGGSDIVRVDAASGARTTLVPATALRPDGGEPLAIGEYVWSPDDKQLMIYVRAAGARRNNPIGDYWLLDRASGKLKQMGQGLPAQSLIYAEFAPDSSAVAYVSNNNLYVEPIAGTPRQLTSDGTAALLNGRSDVVYEEEFGLGRAFEWSPDSKRLAYWQFDTAGVGTFYMITNTDPGLYSKPIPQQYPLPGTTNSAVKIGVVAAYTPGTTWIKLEGDPRNMYVPRLNWTGDGKQLLIQHENRLQNTNTVTLGDPASGAARSLFVDRDDAFVNPTDEIEWLPGNRFTFLSERDGWRHLYAVSSAGKLELRTPGAFDVVRTAEIDVKGGWAYFIASPDNPTQRYLYRARLSGAAKVERLTPVGADGTHGYDIAPGAKWAFHTVSRFDEPPRTEVVSLATKAPARTLVDNAAMRAAFAATPHAKPDFFRVDIGGGTQLDAWMIRPPNFDPAKRYPMLMYVYSEPAGQTVADSWGGDRLLWHTMLAQQGYIVASVDSRGANSPRGRAWRKSIYRQVGILASADQAAAIRAMMKDRPYIDSARIGVWGWSGGGAMTLNAMFRYPDLYATGIAVAAPADQRLYNSIYQERYMGLPADNVAGYRDGSPINFAQNLKSNLLIVQGTGDDNVHYQNLEKLADRLIGLNKQFSMMAYPDRTHGISEKPNTRLHLFTMLTNYLHDHLPAGGR